MTQQTAVQWLYHKMSTCTSDEMVGNINKWFEQAQQMEKEQIIDAWRDGDNDSMYSMKELDKQAEDYYKETYERVDHTKQH